MHQRVASEWRIGRVLLAGDAAHLNNPLGAFGLNSGIHDAVNLADKLGRVWRGEAGEALLDLYVRQRRAADDRAGAGDVDPQQAPARGARSRRCSARAWRSWSPSPPIPSSARAFLLESSMISGLRKSEAIE